MASQSPAQDLAQQEPATAAEPSNKAPEAFSAAAESKNADPAPAVRFSSAVEEIKPDAPATEAPIEREETSPFTEVAADQLKALTQSLQSKQLQEHRFNTFGYEAFSLPPSRVPSREDDSNEATRQSTATSGNVQSPHESPRLSAMASPPLTPAGSDPTTTATTTTTEKSSKAGEKTVEIANEPTLITPAPSSSHEAQATGTQRTPLTHRPASSDHVIQRPASAEDQQADQGAHRRSMFRIGPGSVPVSRETSPNRSSAAFFYSKPMTPTGDVNDPYSKGRRQNQQHNAPNRRSIDSRFVFSRKKPTSPSSSKSNLTDKRGSGIFGSKNGSDDGHGDGNHSGSMSDLKRFFRKSGHGHHHGHHHHHSKKRDSSPDATKTGTKTPPASASRSTQQLPFGDDHGLTTKYGKLGRVLGSGAGGSVRLMKRKEDNTVFAVKEFRARHTYETEKEYNKKVTAEFCVGSTLHHGNIIETLDIMQEKGRWFEVMEYAPYDLFAIVMTGRMTRAEVTCCFLQILNGVTYLHSLGLAHRDLKLDNVVVSELGIMKIIDFGSAHVFKYPFENDFVPARGIVGSDPYLAPEVYDSKEYDAAAVDIWSLAIIYCCMTLRRFPWKLPRMSDNSFKLFASEPTPGHDPKHLVPHAKSTSDLVNTPPRDFMKGHEDEMAQHDNHHHHHRQKSEEPTAASTAPHPVASSEKKEVIRGPWRILRLLPRESRNIIHRMLDLNPKTRARMDEILEEPWVADTIICQQLENGMVSSADDHTHILEPPASQPKPV